MVGPLQRMEQISASNRPISKLTQIIWVLFKKNTVYIPQDGSFSGQRGTKAWTSFYLKVTFGHLASSNSFCMA